MGRLSEAAKRVDPAPEPDFGSLQPPAAFFTGDAEDVWKAAEDHGIEIREVLLKGDPEPIGRVESIHIEDGVWVIRYDASGPRVACLKESAIAGVIGQRKAGKKAG